MRNSLFLLLLLFSLRAKSQLRSAQGNYTPPTANARFYQNADLPVIKDKYPKFASGSPYFLEDWIEGDIQLSTGEIYHNVKMRLDLVENTLQYVNDKGVEVVAGSNIKTILLNDSINGHKYKFVHSAYIGGATSVEPGWYQVLASGNATFFKRTVKSIVEPRNYSSGDNEPSVNSQTEYYLYADWGLSRIKKIKEIPLLLKDKTDELEKYIATKKLSGKSDPDFVSLIEYYNGLFEPSQQKKAF